MNDTCGRNINYLRISITDLCNLRCKYCVPEKGVPLKMHRDILRFEEIAEIVKEAAGLGITKVRLTGGEPLVRKGIAQLIKMIAGNDEINDIALTTNGILLKKYAQELKEAGLKRVNISIDSLNEDKYREITRGGNLIDVLAGIAAAQKAGLKPIKLNVVLIGGFNDSEIESFIRLTIDHDLDVRFIELMPIGEASSWSQKNFISNRVVLQRFPGLIPLLAEDKGSPAEYYRLPGAKGKIGLINPISNQFCKNCNRIRLTADGKLKPCLHSDQEVDIRDSIRNSREKEKSGILANVLKVAIIQKPAGHQMNIAGYEPIIRNMYQIGG